MNTPFSANDLTYGQKNNMRHNLRRLDEAAQRFVEAILTCQRTADQIVVGMENYPDRVADIVTYIRKRWDAYEIKGEWPNVSDGMPRATGVNDKKN